MKIKNHSWTLVLPGIHQCTNCGLLKRLQRQKRLRSGKQYFEWRYYNTARESSYAKDFICVVDIKKDLPDEFK
jgi:hypothetical protein